MQQKQRDIGPGHFYLEAAPPYRTKYLLRDIGPGPLVVFVYLPWPPR